MRKLLLFLTIMVVAAPYGLFHSQVWKIRAQVVSETPAGYVIPSRFSRILALGNQGLLSDFLFLKAATFFGGRAGQGKALDKADWEYFIDSLESVTDLDPYFVDPYFLAEGLLAWDAGLPEEANKLLEKGTKYRPSDWRLPFFIGFNHFYFLRNYGKAADYIMTASRLPGSPGYFPTLAARLAYYGGKSKTALLFLRQMLEESNNPVLNRRMEKRLLALERAVAIEEALDNFKMKEGRMPVSLAELVSKDYLDRLPEDPYGGKWGVLNNGRVFSTSRFAETFGERKGSE
jgi:tetratricopeptide (TPR) repeat protein